MIYDEPDIIVNGVPLSVGEAMAVRVALSSFLIDMQTNGLGDDEHGKAMSAGYIRNTRTVLAIMMGTNG